MLQVRQLSNKSVSWIRRRDAHILTVDRFTFIADERFQAFLVEATDTWTLQVSCSCCYITVLLNMS